jgi:hypothetical protein
MSTSADITANGNGSANHDHILRPRALKPGNPAVLRAQVEEGLLAVAHENGNSSGQTRFVYPQLGFTCHSNVFVVAVQHQYQKMRHHQHTLYPLRASR